LFTVLAASTLLLISCRGSKPETASTPGADSGAITQNMVRLADAPPFYVDQVGMASNPKGDTEIPLPSASPLAVSGWAADPTGGLASGIEIAIDQKPYPATYGLERPDVAAALKNPACERSGFKFTIPASQFSIGVHTVAVRIINKDRRGYFETPALHVLVE
jgi:hypothetical protein